MLSVRTKELESVVFDSDKEELVLRMVDEDDHLCRLRIPFDYSGVFLSMLGSAIEEVNVAHLSADRVRKVLTVTGFAVGSSADENVTIASVAVEGGAQFHFAFGSIDTDSRSIRAEDMANALLNSKVGEPGAF